MWRFRITFAMILSWQWGVAPVQGQGIAQRPTAAVTTCVTSECHGGVVSAPYAHAPAARLKCFACHESVDAATHSFSLTFAENELCTTCHVQRHRTYVHEPVREGRCVECHDPHGSDHQYHLRGDPAGGLCLLCHDASRFTDQAHVHGPVRLGACAVCHEPHSSWNWRLLIEPEDRLCRSCHGDVASAVEVARHTHPPVQEGSCLACHDPHASSQAAQLLQSPKELCGSCHTNVRDAIADAPHVHGAVEDERSCLACHEGHASMMPRLLRSPPLNLCLSCHDRQVETPDGRTLTNMAELLADNPDHHGPIRRADCSACHDPHASQNFSLLEQAYPPMFYAPFDLHNYRLCFTCHLTEMVTQEDGRQITGFRDGIRNLHFVHVNMEERGRTCRACHEVHASKRPFHVSESVPYGPEGWLMPINFEALPDGGTCSPACHETKTYTRAAPDEAPLGPAPVDGGSSND